MPLAEAQLPKKPSGYVTDQARVLNSRTRLQLEAVLRDLERKTKAQVAVVTINTLDDVPIEDVAVELFAKWGVGQKGKDNGVLFLTAVKDRKTRIEVGYGLEGVITDAQANQILNQAVHPLYKAGQMDKGLVSGAVTLAQLIAQDAGVALSGVRSPVGRSAPRRKASLLEKILGVIFLIIMIPVLIRHPWLIFFLLSSGRGGYRGGGGFGGGFGGFGGGLSGGGGSSGSW